MTMGQPLRVEPLEPARGASASTSSAIQIQLTDHTPAPPSQPANDNERPTTQPHLSMLSAAPDHHTRELRLAEYQSASDTNAGEHAGPIQIDSRATSSSPICHAVRAFVRLNAMGSRTQQIQEGSRAPSYSSSPRSDDTSPTLHAGNTSILPADGPVPFNYYQRYSLSQILSQADELMPSSLTSRISLYDLRAILLVRISRGAEIDGHFHESGAQRTSSSNEIGAWTAEHESTVRAFYMTCIRRLNFGLELNENERQLLREELNWLCEMNDDATGEMASQQGESSGLADVANANEADVVNVEQAADDLSSPSLARSSERRMSNPAVDTHSVSYSSRSASPTPSTTTLPSSTLAAPSDTQEVHTASETLPGFSHAGSSSRSIDHQPQPESGLEFVNEPLVTLLRHALHTYPLSRPQILKLINHAFAYAAIAIGHKPDMAGRRGNAGVEEQSHVSILCKQQLKRRLKRVERDWFSDWVDVPAEVRQCEVMWRARAKIGVWLGCCRRVIEARGHDDASEAFERSSARILVTHAERMQIARDIRDLTTELTRRYSDDRAQVVREYDAVMRPPTGDVHPMEMAEMKIRLMRESVEVTRMNGLDEHRIRTAMRGVPTPVVMKVRLKSVRHGLSTKQFSYGCAGEKELDVGLVEGRLVEREFVEEWGRRWVRDEDEQSWQEITMKWWTNLVAVDEKARQDELERRRNGEGMRALLRARREIWESEIRVLAEGNVGVKIEGGKGANDRIDIDG